jgi:hypothetical protein
MQAAKYIMHGSWCTFPQPVMTRTYCISCTFFSSEDRGCLFDFAFFKVIFSKAIAVKKGIGDGNRAIPWFYSAMFY